MRRTLVLLLLFALPAVGQFKRQEIFTGTATTSWVTIKSAIPSAKITSVEVSNDGAASTDTLMIALGKDTTSTRILPLRYYNSAGESYKYPPLYVDSVRVKSSGTVPYRVLIMMDR
jgi:hypothetical protein